MNKTDRLEQCSLYGKWLLYLSLLHIYTYTNFEEVELMEI